MTPQFLPPDYHLSVIPHRSAIFVPKMFPRRDYFFNFSKTFNLLDHNVHKHSIVKSYFIEPHKFLFLFYP